MPLNAQQVDCVVPWPLFVRWFALHYPPPISWNDAREWLEWIDDVRACLCLRASHRQGAISHDVRTMWHFHIGGFNRYLSDCVDRFIRWHGGSEGAPLWGVDGLGGAFVPYGVSDGASFCGMKDLMARLWRAWRI